MCKYIYLMPTIVTNRGDLNVVDRINININTIVRQPRVADPTCGISIFEVRS